MTKTTSLRISAGLTAILLTSVPLTALAKTSTSNEILKCQDIENNKSRLDCFDSLADQINPKPSPSEPKLVAPDVSTDIPTIKEAPQPPVPVLKSNTEAIQDFGKNLDAAPKPKETALLTPKGEVIFTVKHVQIFDHVKKRIYMTNGQVWQQTTGTNLDIEEGKPPAGTTAKITKSGFGGYKLKLNDKKWGVKVKRVR